jgi:hypothetical protein
VLTQDSTGRLLVTSAQEGKPLERDQLKIERLYHPPALLDGHSLVFPRDSEHLMRFDLFPGKELWRRVTPKPSVNAVSPQVLAKRNRLVALIDGWQLERLDLESGRPLWQARVPTDANLLHATLDDVAVYLAAGRSLHALSLVDGKPLWTTPLPPYRGPWNVVAAGEVLVAHPHRPELEQRRPWLVGGLLPAVPRTWSWRDVPVLIVDSTSGKVVQRFSLPADGPGLTVGMDNGGLLVGTTRSITRFQSGTARLESRSHHLSRGPHDSP